MSKPSTTLNRRRLSDGAPPRQVMRHRVRQSIEQLILHGAHRPGERLVQEQLARQLNVSRAVVREALMELQAGGLVQTTDNRGAMVAPLDPERLMEAFEMREVMEGVAARRCCDRMTLNQLRELRELNEAMDRHFQARQWKEGGKLDRQFHLRLIEIAGSQMLSQLVAGCFVVSKFVTVEIPDVSQPAQDHRELLDLIASGDGAAAEQLAREQVRTNRTHVENALAAGAPLHWLTTSLEGSSKA